MLFVCCVYSNIGYQLMFLSTTHLHPSTPLTMQAAAWGISSARGESQMQIQGQQRNKFIEDLLAASDSPIPMDR